MAAAGVHLYGCASLGVRLARSPPSTAPNTGSGRRPSEREASSSTRRYAACARRREDPGFSNIAAIFFPGGCGIIPFGLHSSGCMFQAPIAVAALLFKIMFFVGLRWSSIEGRIRSPARLSP